MKKSAYTKFTTRSSSEWNDSNLNFSSVDISSQGTTWVTWNRAVKKLPVTRETVTVTSTHIYLHMFPDYIYNIICQIFVGNIKKMLNYPPYPSVQMLLSVTTVDPYTRAHLKRMHFNKSLI